MEQRVTAIDARSHPGLILAVLSLSGGAYALLQSLVVPALPVLQDDLHTTTSGVAWVFTSYLLAASVVPPAGKPTRTRALAIGSAAEAKSGQPSEATLPAATN